MINISATRLQEVLQRGEGKRFLLIGDLMIDRYLWGNVTRISPEAPVPIINIEEEEVRLGGAANVANNLIGLKAKPIVVGAVGDDRWGEVFRQRLLEQNLSADGLLKDRSRPTTIKTRIIGNNQHVARVDREKIHAIDPQVQDNIARFVEKIMPDIDGVILEDYNKGLLTPGLIQCIISAARLHNKMITVDPKFDNFWEYRNVTLFKPNKKEAAEALAMCIDDESSVRKAGKKLQEKLTAQNVLITLGEKGMALFEQDGQISFTDAQARKVSDVSGAGDTVIGAAAFALTAGATPKEAVSIANLAAGVVCGEVGVVPITSEQLLNAVKKN